MAISPFGTWPLVVVAVLLAVLGGTLVVAGGVALKRRNPLGFALRTLTGLLFLTLGALAGGVVVGMTGYRALTNEEIVARIIVRPVGVKQFMATFIVAGQPDTTYAVAGDQIYVDSHILKWKSWANVLGLHTAYALDRVEGRYADIAEEQSAPRTVYSLAPQRRVDLFGLRMRYAFLAPLFDAEYGSGTFVPVVGPADFDVLVSSTGLLIRKHIAGSN